MDDLSPSLPDNKIQKTKKEFHHWILESIWYMYLKTYVLLFKKIYKNTCDKKIYKNIYYYLKIKNYWLEWYGTPYGARMHLDSRPIVY